MILSHMFNILPYVFIYEIWVKISIFLTGINTHYDEVASLLIYGEVTQLDFDKECFYLNGEPHEKKFLKEVITGYICNGFVDKFYLPEEPIRDSIVLLLRSWQYTITTLLVKLFSK